MSDRPRVYLTRRLPQPALDLLTQHVHVSIWPGDLPPPRAVLMKAVADIDGLLTLPVDHVNAALLDAAPYLRVISNYGTDYEHIDLAAATHRRILVTNTPDIPTETSADFTLALMLSAARRVNEAAQYVKAGHWRSWGAESLLGRDVHGATLGLIGLGRIGQAVARRAQGFGMRVLYTDPQRQMAVEQSAGLMYTPLEDLLMQSDIISLHCPLIDETYHLIDRDTLALLKPEALLINTAHGLLIDTAALVEALQHSLLIAALDVTSPEPLPAKHPLLSLPNAIITPHIASASSQTYTRMALIAAENMIAVLNGEHPPFLVNPAAWTDHERSVGQS